MSDDDGEDPLADRTDEEPADRQDDDGFEDGRDVEWVEDVGNEADRGDDPFERMGEGTGPRHGDPFDAFEADDDAAGNERTDPDGHESGDATGSESAGATGDEPTGSTGRESRDATDHPGLPDGADSDADPFREFDEPTTDPFGEGESTFAGADLGDIDDEGVWERMESTDTEARAVPGKRYVDVNKHSYCETCEHFSEPPDVSCSHEGTDILEFVDMETVRVVDCPVVAERNALEDVD